MNIVEIIAYEIIASGGYPSIECKAILEDGSVGIASVPYGASAGSHEAAVLLDGGDRLDGKGMITAITNIQNKIVPLLIGKDAYDQRMLDQLMIDADGTPNKSNFGGNAILAVSMAVVHAAAQSKKIPLYKYLIETYNLSTQLASETLPSPMVVSIEGGKHADNSTDIQEYCLTAVNNKSKREQLDMILECYHKLKEVLKSQGYSTNVGNEGAFAPSGIKSNTKPLELLSEAVEKAGYKLGDDVMFSIDAAASEFYEDGMYHLKLEERDLTPENLIGYYNSWLYNFPVITIEDMLYEDDWDHWVTLTKMAQDHGVYNIGDDLTVTNIERLNKAIEMNAITGLLVKLNQIGTVTETIDACGRAEEHHIITVPSHRGGGETNDTTMIDVAVAVGAKFIKVGPTRGERVVKYNRLLEIERDLTGN